MSQTPHEYVRTSSREYIHACERAELLGFPVPDEEEFEKAEAQNRVNDDEDDAIIQNLDSSDEAAQRISGGLDELNSILSATQKKINRFKNVCGSLSTLLKVRVSSRNNTPDHVPTEQKHNEIKDIEHEVSVSEEEKLTLELSDDKGDTGNTVANATTVPKKIDLNEKMGSHLDKLDSLINKAENAQYSMRYQTKQMKTFMK